jgi:ABC-2 type transport system ATP-binding protein
MAVLEVRGLTKRFGEVTALREVSFSLDRGEIVGVLGPNGAGKTTLIHSILGLIKPTSGRITLFGKPMDGGRTELLKRMNFASNYVSLPFSLTPFENLMVYALMYEVPEPAKRCDEVLGLFGIASLRDKRTRALSSGQMMRLCLAKAMINGPDILLLDEPTAGLDPETARNTRELLKRLSSETGLSVLYTSHNLREVQEVAGRVLILQEGEVVVQGPSAELFGRYQVANLEELFFKVLKR